MLGIDLTKISRFEDAKEALINKVLHPNEILEYNKVQNKAYFLAARWAIKEALFKADNSLFDFNKIEIKKDGRVYKYPGYIITTSSEDDYYIATVMKER